MKKRKWIEWKLKKCDLMTMGGVIFAIFAVVLAVQCLLHHYFDSMFPLGAGIDGQVLVFETFFLIPELLKILIGIAGCEFWIFKFKKMQAN